MPGYGVTTALAALALFCSASHAHMIMVTPTPFNNETIDNSPLPATGELFPCKLTGDPSTFYNSAGISNTMAVGEQQTLSFRGSAVHGGGSCQLAITSDKQPSTKSVWQVIQSMEGGCPSKDGSGPSTYSYTIPNGVAPGDYVFAWTWVSKEAGQPEYYMNCAPITVTGGSTKRSEESTLGKRDGLPDLWVANQASINSCKTTAGFDITYPYPGPTLEHYNPSASYSNYTSYGTNCWPVGGSDGTSGSASSASGSTSGNGTSVSSGSSSSAPAGSTGSAASASAAAPSTASAMSSPAGVAPSAAPSAGSSLEGSATSLASSAVATSSATGFASGSAAAPTTLASSVVAATTMPNATNTVASSTPSSAPSDAPAAAPSSTGSSSGSSSGSAGGLTGACTTEGMWNCIGGSQFQRCASGQWSVLQAMAAGTTCTPGQSQSLWARSGSRNKVVRLSL